VIIFSGFAPRSVLSGRARPSFPGLLVRRDDGWRIASYHNSPAS
jgi:hypothetical protein